VGDGTQNLQFSLDTTSGGASCISGRHVSALSLWTDYPGMIATVAGYAVMAAAMAAN